MRARRGAKQFDTMGSMLVAASLFLVLVWWNLSVYLFVAGVAAYAAAWVAKGAPLTPVAATAQE